MSEDNISKLNVKFKRPPQDEKRTLRIVDRMECNHKFSWANGDIRNVTYLIREGETDVECGSCHTKLDPVFVLRQLASRETMFEQTRLRYNDEMKRLSERSRTECQHCGRMTTISRTKAKPNTPEDK